MQTRVQTTESSRVGTTFYKLYLQWYPDIRDWWVGAKATVKKEVPYIRDQDVPLIKIPIIQVAGFSGKLSVLSLPKKKEYKLEDVSSFCFPKSLQQIQTGYLENLINFLSTIDVRGWTRQPMFCMCYIETLLYRSLLYRGTTDLSATQTRLTPSSTWCCCSPNTTTDNSAPAAAPTTTTTTTNNTHNVESDDKRGVKRILQQLKYEAMMEKAALDLKYKKIKQLESYLSLE
ncbi:hypothetical protein PS15m_003895 [Mucor circinelloides]